MRYGDQSTYDVYSLPSSLSTGTPSSRSPVQPLRTSKMALSPTFAVLLIFFIIQGFTTALWPIPASMSSGAIPIKLSPAFDIHLDILNPPSDLLSAVSRTISRTTTDSFQRLVVGRSAVDAKAVKSARTLTSLVLSLRPGSPVRSIADETNQPVTSKSEGYSLSISHDTPSATLVAQSTLGLLRGLTSFEQLWYDYNGTKYMLDGGVEMVDQPAFVRLLTLPVHRTGQSLTCSN